VSVSRCGTREGGRFSKCSFTGVKLRKKGVGSKVPFPPAVLSEIGPATPAALPPLGTLEHFRPGKPQPTHRDA